MTVDLLLDVIAILITSLVCIRPIKMILKGRSNILHFCMVTFYVVQVVPLILKCFWGVDESLCRYPGIHIAMTDEMTSYIYSLFVVFSEILLSFFSKTISYKAPEMKAIFLSVSEWRKSRLLSVILFLGMFLPIIGVLFAPRPEIYLKYAYFYTHIESVWSDIYTYHVGIISTVNQVAFFCVVLFYLFNEKRKYVPFVYFATIIITWVSGKRTLLILILLGILVIDIIKKTYVNKKSKLLFKIIYFFSIAVGYFILYAELTGKGNSTSFYHLYSIYFARMSNVQVAIYDALYSHEILDYFGQTILFDAFFFIPRILWENKPVIYSKYFTSYVMGYGTIDIDWQFQVNLWTEYISNFGLFGPILGIIFIYFISKVSIKGNSVLVYLIGLIFAVLYTLFGFESIVQYIWLAWLAMLAVSKFKQIKLVIK